MKAYQIKFKNGNTLEFASKKIAASYAKMHNLSAPVKVEI